MHLSRLKLFECVEEWRDEDWPGHVDREAEAGGEEPQIEPGAAPQIAQQQHLKVQQQHILYIDI